MFSHSRPHSISSSRCSSTKSSRSIWSKIGKMFHRSHSSSRSADFSRQTTGNYSNSTLSDASVKTVDIAEVDRSSSHRRHRKPLVVHEEPASQMLIPPFSPTYCKSNEFPYSNFYVKLPDGRWMIRYRDGNRDILRTDIMEGYMI
ncbi:unnamed protein product [Mucor hiemalis]